MLTCPDAQDLLSARMDGELAPPRREEVERHLASCADCRAVEAELRELDHLLQAPAALPPAADLAPRVCAAVFPPPARVIPLPRRAPPVRRPLWRAAAAAALLACASGALALLVRPRGPAPAAAAPRPAAPRLDARTAALRAELARVSRELDAIHRDLSAFHARAAAEARQADHAVASRSLEVTK